MFECNHSIDNADEPNGKELIAVPCTILKKDGPQASTWSSRWSRSLSNINAPCAGCDGPWLAYPGDRPCCNPQQNPMSAADRAACLNFEGDVPGIPNTCHWFPDSGDGSIYTAGLVPGSSTSAGNTVCQGSPCLKKWSLTQTGATTATLDLTTRQGYTGQWSCDNFNCIGRSTFTLVRRDTELVHAALPKCICVTSVKTVNDDTTCTDDTQECDCCLDFDGGFPLEIAPCGVSTPFGVVMYRDGVGTSGTPTPTSYKCGFFWGALLAGVTQPNGLDIGDYLCDGYNGVGFLAYCTGHNAWSLDIYTTSDAGSTWDFAESATLSGTTCAEGGIQFSIAFTGNVTATGYPYICCPTTDTCCNDETITLTVSGATDETGCAFSALNGTWTLTRVSNTTVDCERLCVYQSNQFSMSGHNYRLKLYIDDTSCYDSGIDYSINVEHVTSGTCEVTPAWSNNFGATDCSLPKTIPRHGSDTHLPANVSLSA
jgi:hypothetical protein